jgi:CRP-like cAMP-binding protein
MNLFGRSARSQRLEELRRFQLFSKLSNKELLDFDELLHERIYLKDEIVFEAGDPGVGLFFILRGRVKAVPARPLLEAIRVEFGPGEFFGEISLFDEAERTATVVALEETRTVALLRTEFFSLVQRNKNIGVKILFELSRAVCHRARQLLLGESHLPSL